MLLLLTAMTILLQLQPSYRMSQSLSCCDIFVKLCWHSRCLAMTHDTRGRADAQYATRRTRSL